MKKNKIVIYVLLALLVIISFLIVVNKATPEDGIAAEGKLFWFSGLNRGDVNNIFFVVTIVMSLLIVIMLFKKCGDAIFFAIIE